MCVFVVSLFGLVPYSSRGSERFQYILEQGDEGEGEREKAKSRKNQQRARSISNRREETTTIETGPRLGKQITTASHHDHRFIHTHTHTRSSSYPLAPFLLSFSEFFFPSQRLLSFPSLPVHTSAGDEYPAAATEAAELITYMKLQRILYKAGAGGGNKKGGSQLLFLFSWCARFDVTQLQPTEPGGRAAICTKVLLHHPPSVAALNAPIQPPFPF